MSFARVALAAGLMIAAAIPAHAQNVGNNAGIWWTPAPGQPAPFTLLNPLTTVYGRIGFLRAFPADSDTRTTPPLISPVGTRLSDAWGMMLGFGARVMPVLRYELQLGGTFSTVSTTSVGVPLIVATNNRVASAQLMNNLYLDVAPFFANALWGLNPYVMGGVGVSWNTLGDSTRVFPAPLTPFPGTGGTRADFAWNVGAGLQWQFLRNMILDVGYRYLDAGRWASTRVPPDNTLILRPANRSHQVMFSLVVPVDGLLRGW